MKIDKELIVSAVVTLSLAVLALLGGIACIIMMTTI